MWEEDSAVGNAVALSMGEAVPPWRTFHMSTAWIQPWDGSGLSEPLSRWTVFAPRSPSLLTVRVAAQALKPVLVFYTVSLRSSPSSSRPCLSPRTTPFTSNAPACR